MNPPEWRLLTTNCWQIDLATKLRAGVRAWAIGLVYVASKLTRTEQITVHEVPRARQPTLKPASIDSPITPSCIHPPVDCGMDRIVVDGLFH